MKMGMRLTRKKKVSPRRPSASGSLTSSTRFSLRPNTALSASCVCLLLSKATWVLRHLVRSATEIMYWLKA